MLTTAQRKLPGSYPSEPMTSGSELSFYEAQQTPITELDPEPYPPEPTTSDSELSFYESQQTPITKSDLDDMHQTPTPHQRTQSGGGVRPTWIQQTIWKIANTVVNRASNRQKSVKREPRESRDSASRKRSGSSRSRSRQISGKGNDAISHYQTVRQQRINHYLTSLPAKNQDFEYVSEYHNEEPSLPLPHRDPESERQTPLRFASQDNLHSRANHDRYRHEQSSDFLPSTFIRYPSDGDLRRMYDSLEDHRLDVVKDLKRFSASFVLLPSLYQDVDVTSELAKNNATSEEQSGEHTEPLGEGVAENPSESTTFNDRSHSDGASASHKPQENEDKVPLDHTKPHALDNDMPGLGKQEPSPPGDWPGATAEGPGIIRDEKADTVQEQSVAQTEILQNNVEQPTCMNIVRPGVMTAEKPSAEGELLGPGGEQTLTTSNNQSSPRTVQPTSMANANALSPAEESETLQTQELASSGSEGSPTVQSLGSFLEGAPGTDRIGRKWESATVIMKRILDDKATTTPTSVMSFNTRKLLGVSRPVMIWNDEFYGYLPCFVSQGKVSAVRELLAVGCNPGRAGKPRWVPMLNAVLGRTEKHNKCLIALLQSGADVGAKDPSSGKTYLHFAIAQERWSGYSTTVYILLMAKANPNARDKMGNTPLLTLLTGNGPLLKEERDALMLLLAPNFGTKIYVRDPNLGENVLHLAIRRRDPYALDAVFSTIYDNELKKSMLQELNASGFTPLLLLVNVCSFHTEEAAVNATRLLELLLENGADPDDKDSTNGDTVLHCVIGVHRSIEAFELLLKYNANPLVQNFSHKTASALLQEKARDHPSDRWYAQAVRKVSGLGQWNTPGPAPAVSRGSTRFDS
ncbi:uncharacterized protein A1O5_10517 [Cladophialophora psammophila CBS 110553]|uniref:Uncharacterized protein n=1 Tax=Cladophialophora psammophila CBS 110553 TaxID=1182543 RepID=W9WN09_9EURO|nr:uncharacterized protein A1O5_10517 [Cladophialophora psammophila CBS 110553]EXJ66365.1 hypothetical protein A1O5_10517 [Cladophialophora psammophila CBS 110553]